MHKTADRVNECCLVVLWEKNFQGLDMNQGKHRLCSKADL